MIIIIIVHDVYKLIIIYIRARINIVYDNSHRRRRAIVVIINDIPIIVSGVRK